MYLLTKPPSKCYDCFVTYRIRFRNTGSLHESEPKTLEEARTIAVQLSNWNQRVDVVDADLIWMETEPCRCGKCTLDAGSAVVERFYPYSEEGARQLEAMSSSR